MLGRLYILAGTSGCGKTTLLNSICALHEETFAVRVPKYSERETRMLDAQRDDIIHCDRICLDDFDLVYMLNGTKYGIRFGDIEELLLKGLNPIVIISDFRIIRTLKHIYRQYAKAIFISSKIDATKLHEIHSMRLGHSSDIRYSNFNSWNGIHHWDSLNINDGLNSISARNEISPQRDPTSLSNRIHRMKTFDLRYSEQIHLFDYVVFNCSENKPEKMTEQMKTIILESSRYERFKRKIFPPIFVVAAKDDFCGNLLLADLQDVCGEKIKIASTHTAGPFTWDGRRDVSTSSLRTYERTATDTAFDWYVTGRQKTALHYTASCYEIDRYLLSGVPQVFFSDIGNFGQFRSRWPDNSVFVYIHCHNPNGNESTGNKNETNFEFSRKYILNIAQFDHVVLDTTFREDLLEQMLNLIDYYSKMDEMSLMML